MSATIKKRWLWRVLAALGLLVFGAMVLVRFLPSTTAQRLGELKALGYPASLGEVEGMVPRVADAENLFLVVREAASKRYVHSFALRNKTSGVMLAVRDHSEIDPGENIDVIEAMRLRPGTTLESSAYRSFPLRFGPLLLAMQRGEEFLDIE